MARQREPQLGRRAQRRVSDSVWGMEEDVELRFKYENETLDEQDASGHPLHRLTVTLPKSSENISTVERAALAQALFTLMWNAAVVFRAETPSAVQAAAQPGGQARRQEDNNQQNTVETELPLPEMSWHFDGTVFSCEAEGATLVEGADTLQVVAPATIMQYLELQLRGKSPLDHPTVFAWHPRDERLALKEGWQSKLTPLPARSSLNLEDTIRPDGTCWVVFHPGEIANKVKQESKAGPNSNLGISRFAQMVVRSGVKDSGVADNKINGISVALAEYRAAQQSLSGTDNSEYLSLLRARKAALQASLRKWRARQRLRVVSLFAPVAVGACQAAISNVEKEITKAQSARQQALKGKDVSISQKMSGHRILNFLRRLFSRIEREKASYFYMLHEGATRARQCAMELRSPQPEHQHGPQPPRFAEARV